MKIPMDWLSKLVYQQIDKASKPEKNDRHCTVDEITIS
jgi:hypothetical protein